MSTAESETAEADHQSVAEYAETGAGAKMLRKNLVSELIRSQRKEGGISEDIPQEYKKFLANKVGGGGVNSVDASNHSSSASNDKDEEADKDKEKDKECIMGENKNGNSSLKSRSSCFLQSIVLKFTTVSDSCYEAPSFEVHTSGADIGRDADNTVSVPSDVRLVAKKHAMVEYIKGYFYLVDGGFENSASIRIGVGVTQNKLWSLEKGSRFSVGNSVFECQGLNAEENLVLSILDGPLKGQTRIISKCMISTLGRSSDNTLCIPDKELSRKHSKIEFNEKLGKFILLDNNSTNGTYVQLVGPYGGKYRLHLNDHILVGRTGFSVNRYDYGLSEEMGTRQTMEDACTIVQHLNIGPLCIDGFAPQSFFGVFDGHVGNQASNYLSQYLHTNIADAILSVSIDTLKCLDDKRRKEVTSETIAGAKVNSSEFYYDNMEDLNVLPDNHYYWEGIDHIFYHALKSSFLYTDKQFIRTSSFPSHGSTATTALILGSRLYCANVGDSRVILSRDFQVVEMSCDHKPGREDELKRIREAGGFVINNRVMGELAVSRAFGDCDFKKGLQGIIEDDIQGGAQLRDGAKIDMSNWDKPLIVAEPEIRSVTITSRDNFILLACDGLYDVFTNEEIVAFIKANMEEHGDTQRCCQNLTHEAIKKRNSRDNVSVILVILNKWWS